MLKVHQASGALLDIVRLLDATLLPDQPHWEWRSDIYDVILWRTPVLKPVSATWLEAARDRGSAPACCPCTRAATYRPPVTHTRAKENPDQHEREH